MRPEYLYYNLSDDLTEGEYYRSHATNIIQDGYYIYLYDADDIYEINDIYEEE